MSIQPRDRNLLFAILALQNHLITQEQLLAGFREFTQTQSAAKKGAAGGHEHAVLMRRILLEQGALSDSAANALEALMEAHLDQHNQDSKASLAAIAPLELSLHQSLQEIDAEIESSLHHSFSKLQPTFDMTLSVAVGKPSANGRFQILRPHAKGGLGEVFVARDEELDREVALKQIRGDDLGLEKRERFMREAEITGKLEHPGIVPIYGLGTDDLGNPYYAMRFIRGQSLGEAIKQFHKQKRNKTWNVATRNKEFRKLLGWFINVCNAISYAHSRGVLHRDIKPSNVMIGRFGETLVVDWGLARVAGVDDIQDSVSDERPLKSTISGLSSNTLEGQAIGTPAYMSPEQASGRLDKLGPSTDVYCLGATLYAILVGKCTPSRQHQYRFETGCQRRFSPTQRIRPGRCSPVGSDLSESDGA